MSIVTKALKFAQKCHAGQVRKYTGHPYIMHPMRVALRTSERALQNSERANSINLEDCVAAALCHDVIEDCGVRRRGLIDTIGFDAADIVVWLTNPSKGSTLPRADRKKIDRDHISKAPRWAKIIK